MDSLNNYINAAVNDTDKVMRINKVYFDVLWKLNTAEPYKMLKRALALSIKTKFLRGQMKSYSNMAGYCRNKGNRQFVKKYSYEYMRIALLMKDSLSYASSLLNMSINLRDEGDSDSSLKCQLIVSGIYERKDATKDQFARLYSQQCATYCVLKNFDKALSCAKKSLKIREEINYADGIDASLGQIAGIYAFKKDYPKIIEYATIARNNRIKSGDSVRVASYSSLIGYAQAFMGKFDSAFVNLNYALGILKRYNSKGDLISLYSQLSEVYEKFGDTKQALHYYKLFKVSGDSLYTVESINNISKTQVLYDVEEKENEIALLDKEKKIQRYGLIFGGLILLAVIFISFFIYKAYKQKKEANILLAEQKKLIEERNKEVMDSINYAKRLQGAILIPESELAKHFSDAFILFKPKDIVSGDFYWFSESEQNRIIAVADCTGHGVPGGFMSMLGYESLQDVALKENITTTSQALKSLDKKMTEALNKSDKSFRDGMDVALCAFSKKENKLLYSGANRPLIQISEGIIIEHKPDKNTIGGDIDNADKQYSTKTIEYKKGDVFYMFTDGYPDQFGGTKINSENSFGLGKKFKYKNLLNLLLSINTKSLREQKQLLEENFEDWKGTLEQVDDVCIIGLRV